MFNRRLKGFAAALLLSAILPLSALASPRDTYDPGSRLQRIVNIILRFFVPVGNDELIPPHP